MQLVTALNSLFRICNNKVKPLTIVSEGAAKTNDECRENDSCRKVIYMGDVQRPQKVNGTCLKKNECVNDG
jgi:hypothetical protein